MLIKFIFVLLVTTTQFENLRQFNLKYMCADLINAINRGDFKWVRDNEFSSNICIHKLWENVFGEKYDGVSDIEIEAGENVKNTLNGYLKLKCAPEHELILQGIVKRENEYYAVTFSFSKSESFKTYMRAKIRRLCNTKKLKCSSYKHNEYITNLKMFMSDLWDKYPNLIIFLVNPDNYIRNGDCYDIEKTISKYISRTQENFELCNDEDVVYRFNDKMLNKLKMLSDGVFFYKKREYYEQLECVSNILSSLINMKKFSDTWDIAKKIHEKLIYKLFSAFISSEKLQLSFDNLQKELTCIFTSCFIELKEEIQDTFKECFHNQSRDDKLQIREIDNYKEIKILKEHIRKRIEK